MTVHNHLMGLLHSEFHTNCLQKKQEFRFFPKGPCFLNYFLARNQTSYRPEREKHVHISRANLMVHSAPVAPLLALKHYFVKTSNQIF